MEEGRPSKTAWRVALRRAAHQVLDVPPVFTDPFALRMVGADEASIRAEATGPLTRGLRAFLSARSRFAEEELAAAVACGATQYVLLGAGLDTFAYRNPWAGSGLRIFEVDFPATQAWKRAHLARIGLSAPPELTYAPVDFECESLAGGLAQAGFDPARITFFSWLGVAPYLSAEAFETTLHFVAGLPAGSGIVFDYAIEPSTLSPEEQAAVRALSDRVAAAGEPFRLFHKRPDLASQLTRLGFTHLEDLDRAAMNARYFCDRDDGFCIRGGMGRLLSATV